MEQKESSEYGPPECLRCLCSNCHKQLEVLWLGGIIPSKEYVLVASWVTCAKCYDAAVNEFKLKGG